MEFKPNSPPLSVSHTGSSALAGGSGASGGGATFWMLGGFLSFGEMAGTGAGAGAWACSVLGTFGLEFSRDFCHCCCCWEMLMA